MTCPFCGAVALGTTITRDERGITPPKARTVYGCGSVGQSYRRNGNGRPFETVRRSDICTGTPWIDSCRIAQRKVHA